METETTETAQITRKYVKRLRALAYSVDTNPLLEPQDIPIRQKRVRTGGGKSLVDPVTGEVIASSVIQTIEEKDPAEFVKVFAAGIAASYSLGRSSQRVFQAVLQEYEASPMTGGFADSIYLSWFDGGLCGRKIGMSEQTFNRGLYELLDKKFLAPRSPNLYWVNPALFFKGDRVLFVKEYRRTKTMKKVEKQDNKQLQLEV